MGKCCCLCAIAVVGVLVLGLAIGIPLGMKKAKEAVKQWDQNAVGAACQTTSYPATCNQTFAGQNHPHDTNGVTRFSTQRSATGVNETLGTVNAMNTTDPTIAGVVELCNEVLVSAIEELEASAAALDTVNTLDAGTLEDIQCWVSAAMEMHATCLAAFQEVTNSTDPALVQKAAHTNELLSNSLAFINALAQYGKNLLAWKPTGFSLPDGFNLDALKNLTIPTIPKVGNRRLLAAPEENVPVEVDEAFPRWMDMETRRHLLQAPPKYDVVVAKDGSGNFATIQAAVDANKNNKVRKVIYIKAGRYNEQVIVPKKAKFLTFIGDGDQTVITGRRNVALMKGMTTFKSGTLIVSGPGFIGRSFRVENTAGADGHQAVAFRGSADGIAMYQVTFDSFQDTLYAHTFRQYYRDCNVYGTVDFIFGNSATVFQNCRIIAKKSTIPGQQNTYTAQGRIDPHQPTGLSFQNCVIDGTPELKASTAQYRSYLGRPWKEYSVCVIMKSEIMGHVAPEGWLPWNTTNFGLWTSYFAEYNNFGAGSGKTKRVPWSHQVKDAKTANFYQANSFIRAQEWVNGNGIPLTTTL